MSGSNRKPYLNATSVTQDLLDDCADNLSCQIELIVDIQTPDGFIYASDRNKYVGGRFYQALLQFPQINRTIGEWVSPTIEFSTINLELSNVDGRFNKYLPEGESYQSWIGNSVEIKIGLAEIESSYKTIFFGVVTDVGGFSRSTKSVTIIARDTWDKLSVTFPTFAFNFNDYPQLEQADGGKLLPFILGDWKNDISMPAVVTSTIVNRDNELIYYDEDNNPNPVNIVGVVSFNPLDEFDTNDVFLIRNEKFYPIHSSDVAISSLKSGFVVSQNTGLTKIIEKVGDDPVNFLYESTDEIVVKVKENTTNIILQCKKILETYAGVTSSDYDAISWDYYTTKMAHIKSRVWIQEPESVIDYVLSMLEQVMIEAFIDRNRKIRLSALHFDDLNDNPTLKINNWDIEKDSLSISLDDNNNFNRLKGFFNLEPYFAENTYQTAYFKNTVAISQIGKEITKQLAFPNLYEKSQVEHFVSQSLRFASAYPEFLSVTVTWRFLLVEISEMLQFNVEIGSASYSSCPVLIRNINYNPQGLKIDLKLWSFQMTPFKNWNPSFAGISGGQYATISQE